MKTPLRRIWLGAVALSIIVGVAVVAHHFLDPDRQRGWLNDIYMVVITISTVGFTEKSDLDSGHQLFMITVIIFGMTAAGYTLSGLFQLLAAGEIERAMGIRKMTRDIAHLKGHTIICGYGRVGRILAEQLHHQHVPYTVIESNPERAQDARTAHVLTITGDATEEASLIEAGIHRADVLVTALPSDADNVFLTLTARNLAPKLTIIARGEHPSTQKKLTQAGANRAVMTAAISARWIASMITRPSAIEFLELLSDNVTLEAELDEIKLAPPCGLIGRSIAQVVADWPHTMLVVAVKDGAGKMTFRPDPSYVLCDQDTVILLGETEAIRRFREAEKV